MKGLVHLLLLVSVVSCFVGCGSKPYPQLLVVADSLIYTNPDRAIVLLKKVKGAMRGEPEATQMYYRLLCIKANDRAYIPHTTDSLILPVLHYYIKKEDKRHLPEAYYYAGRVYRDLGDAPQALDYFEKAEKALPEDGGYDMKAKIYSQMGNLFSYQSMTSEALEMYKKGLACDKILKDSAYMAFDLSDMANMYMESQKTDSALTYYKEATLMSKRLQRTDLFNNF